MPAALDVHVFCDPLDPRGWGSEPGLRWLRRAVPDATWHAHPSVLVPDWEGYDGPEFPTGRSSVAAVCSRVSEESGMPIDEYLWFEDAPSTSKHACRGVAGAYEQDETVGWRFLRAAREATFIGRENLDSPDAVVGLAGRVDGVDADAVELALTAATPDGGPPVTPADRSLDGAAFDLADVTGVSMAGVRPELPTVVLDGTEARRGHSGRIDTAQLTHLVEATTGDAPDDPDTSVPAALEAFSDEGWLAVTELTTLTGAGYDDAIAAARDVDGVVERTFASEPFFRVAAAVSDDAHPERGDDSHPGPADDEAPPTDEPGR